MVADICSTILVLLRPCPKTFYWREKFIKSNHKFICKREKVRMLTLLVIINRFPKSLRYFSTSKLKKLKISGGKNLVKLKMLADCVFCMKRFFLFVIWLVVVHCSYHFGQISQTLVPKEYALSSFSQINHPSYFESFGTILTCNIENVEK